jgi:putative tryptophan/tyrosine transport system substrate-binding protein
LKLVIRLAGVLTLLFSAPPPGAEAQTTKKLPAIGYLSAGFAATAYHPTFVSGLRDLGYVEGKSVAIESRYVEERLERLPALASDLAARRVDVIVVVGGAEAAAAKKVTDRIPIVTIAVADPVGSRLVSSLARPGGNVTGLTSSPGDTRVRGQG